MRPKKGYIIPFEGTVKIGQGYNSRFTHRLFQELGFDATYSLDFLLPDGTVILASRRGVVTKIKNDSDINYSGTDPERGRKAAEQANYIELKHDDGTFTAYYHLKKSSSRVEVGQPVTQRQPIATSGNTGWSTQPHLDFTAYRKNEGGLFIRTFPTKFSNFDGPLEDRVINPDTYR